MVEGISGDFILFLVVLEDFSIWPELFELRLRPEPSQPIFQTSILDWIFLFFVFFFFFSFEKFVVSGV